ncbi:MAG: isochorismate synthase [Thaumarchaeota archaeon]|nr:isochorismate synthase [Nitrososphaerota archaeon]
MKSVLGPPLAASSLLDPQQELLGWVLGTINEGFAQARKEGRTLIHVSSRRLEWAAPPLALLDSPTEDIHLFCGGERLSLGVGVASEYGSASPSSLSRSRAKKALGLDGAPLAVASQVLVMGGWPFSRSIGGKRDGVWLDLPRSRWVVPALTLVSEGGKTTTLTVSVLASPLARRKARASAYYRRLVAAILAARRLDEEAATGHAAPTLRRTLDIPSEITWLSTVDDALEAISQGRMKKVVLSRSVKLTFDGKLQPSAILTRLLALYHDSTVFAVKRRGSVFLGATPENLLSIRDGAVEVDCLAASAPRGRGEAEDDALGARLLADIKSRDEHMVVVQAAVRSISPFSSQVEVALSPTLKKLANIQHLYTSVKARLLPGQDIWSVAISLWPSPAIAGEPKSGAVRWIRSSEPFSRGWFAGVVGCVRGDFQDGRLVVGIRSGLVKDNEAVIYAGAGIVASSVPEKELEETGWKLETMRASLFQGPPDLPGPR